VCSSDLSLISFALRKNSSSSWMAANMVSLKTRPKMRKEQNGLRAAAIASSASGTTTSCKISKASSSASKMNSRLNNNYKQNCTILHLPLGGCRKAGARHNLTSPLEGEVGKMPQGMLPGGGADLSFVLVNSIRSAPLSQPSPSRGEGLEPVASLMEEAKR